MSKLTSIRDFRRELAEIDAMLALHDQLTKAHGADPAAELVAAGLRSRREEISREATERGDERMLGYELDMVFSGRPVVGTTVDSRFLGLVLTGLQEVVQRAVANQFGELRLRGPVRQRAFERSKLRVASTFAGSFGVQFVTTDQQLDLLGDSVSPLYTALSAVVTLFDEEESDDALLGAVDVLGRRGIQKYADLLNRIALDKADLRIGWATGSGTRRVKMTSRTAALRKARLEQVEVKTHTRTEEGRLDEAGIRRGYFEFITEADEVLSGRVNPVLIAELENFFNKPCRGLFTVTVVSDLISGRTTESYRLDALVGPGEEFFQD